MKLVALDVGEKRIGVATADSAVPIAVPHSTILVDGGEFAKIAELLRFEGARHLVVGLPRNSRGEETAQSKRVRDFAAALQDYCARNKLGKPLVRFQDESLTSVMAEEHLMQNRNRKKKRQKGDVDREAATLILQDFLDDFGRKGEAGEETDNRGEEGVKAQVKAPEKKGRGRHRALMILAVVVGLLVICVIGAVSWYSEMIKPVQNESSCVGINPELAGGCRVIDFVVADGESTNTVIDRLESEGVIRSALALRIYLRLHPLQTTVRAGEYTLRNSMKYEEIFAVLGEGSAAETFRMTFYPGETVADAKRHLLAAGYAEAEIDEAFAGSYEHAALAGKPTGASLEGYIYGETYEFYKTATVREILVRVFDEFYKVVRENELESKYAARGLSLYEGLVLASVVQKEARAVDQPNVAQVFLSRMRVGMSLGSDAVIGYAADQINPDRDKTDLSYLNTIGCPWNSRKCGGLPPTPISNPGRSALLAVAEPVAAQCASGECLYFLTGDDQKMYYAHTSTEHNANASKYCRRMCSVL